MSELTYYKNLGDTKILVVSETKQKAIELDVDSEYQNFNKKQLLKGKHMNMMATLCQLLKIIKKYILMNLKLTLDVYFKFYF